MSRAGGAEAALAGVWGLGAGAAEPGSGPSVVGRPGSRRRVGVGAGPRRAGACRAAAQAAASRKSVGLRRVAPRDRCRLAACGVAARSMAAQSGDGTGAEEGAGRRAVRSGSAAPATASGARGRPAIGDEGVCRVGASAAAGR